MINKDILDKLGARLLTFDESHWAFEPTYEIKADGYLFRFHERLTIQSNGDKLTFIEFDLAVSSSEHQVKWVGTVRTSFELIEDSDFIIHWLKEYTNRLNNRKL